MNVVFRLTLLFVFLQLMYFNSSAQEIKITPFEKLDSLQKVAPRPAVVFIYTDWCKYCLAMKNTTFKSEVVVSKLNENFYFLSLDAEYKSDIHLKGFVYSFIPNGNNTGIHELAQQLGTVEGEVNYPTLCILNSKYEIIFQYNEFMKTDSLVKVLNNFSN